MDTREYLVSSSETLVTTAPETQWNQQVFISVLKQDNEMDEKHSPNSDHNMYPSDPLQLLNHVNYYDSKTDVFEQVKKEFPDDEYPQADCSMNSTIISDNNRVLNFIDIQRVKNENTEESLINIKQENRDQMYEVPIKLETPDEIEMLDNPDDGSMHDDLVTQLEGQSNKLCSKNRVNNKKKERQQRYRELNREKLKQREAERRKRIQYLHSSARLSTSSNINIIDLINKGIIDVKSHSSCDLEGGQKSPIERIKRTKEKNSLQQKRDRQQRYREQNREKLKQREAERRQRLQNSV